MSENKESIWEAKKIVDYRLTEIGRENWDVCHRMFIHDLIDISSSIPQLKNILDFYSIGYTPNGGYTMALPRLFLRGIPKQESPKKVTKKK